MKSTISKIKYIPIFGTFIESCYRFITKRKDVGFEIRSSKRFRQDGLVIKIGSNDGSIGDPISQIVAFNPKTQCVFVEPVPHLLDRAKKIWGDNPRFRYINTAVNDGSRMRFYYVDPEAKSIPNLSIDPEQIGSFDRFHILKHENGSLESFIREIDIQGTKLHTLLDEFVDFGVDILHIDTEGWDWKILSQLQLKKCKPIWIIFEYIHLSIEEKKLAMDMLSSSYDLHERGTDIFCILK